MVEEFFLNFHFLRPWLLLFLIVPAFFSWRFFKTANTSSSWEKACDKKLLQFLLLRGSASNRKFFNRIFLLALFAAVISAAGPTWKKLPTPVLTPERPLMILLNLSSDMRQNDILPSRLERAKFEIIDLLQGLKTSQTGLIVYTDEPFLISPITDDAKLIQNLLPAINYDIMPSNGNRLDRAINLAVEKLKNSGFAKGNIIVFAADAGERFDKALEEAQKAAEQKFLVSVIDTAAQTDEKLKLVSRYGKGAFALVSSSDNDIALLDNLLNQGNAELKESQNEQDVWQDMGYYLCFIPLVCCLFFFRRGLFVLLPALLLSSQAFAGWFLNNNQEGLKAFNQGDFQTAEQKFEDLAWKAAAQYRAGDYAQAAQNYAKKQDVTSMYNLGNALAKSGKIEEAIKKYEEVLQNEPNHEDAKFNLEYLKKQQQNQQQQQQQQQQNQNQSQDKSQPQASSERDDNQPQNNQGENQDQPQGNNQNNGQGQNQGENEQPQQADDNSPNNAEEDNNPANGQASPSQGNIDEQDSLGSKDKKQDAQEGGAMAKQGEEQEKYDEKVQAKVQQLRQIPEDPGGLLKAFIAKEYRLNRYGDD